ncbi:hypothetical protein CANINC_002778 [Pichia inconspicua]|uniref:Protein BCP1 n=1 Tax=Pichia inconspicua TaxID=52247 RepID=A0A4T0X0N5_9ASCO|nr:hypothetical protein CANINC_002778 [[Candida] inconspicua]
MAKRTQEETEYDLSDIDVSSTDDEDLQVEDEIQDDDMINIDFDFYNLNPTVDFHATKNFLRQLFQDDAILFPLSELTDLILKEGNIGTTIKTDGVEGDPFSVLTVVNINKNLKSKAIQELTKYYIEKTKKNPQFNVLLRQLFSPSSKHKVGMIVSERLVNMPVETMPPMYNILLDEMEKTEDKEEYDFDYFLIPSRVVKLVASVVDAELADEDDSKTRKKSKKSSGLPSEYDYVHYEDEQLEKNALHYGYFDFTHKNVDADARRVFNDYGIEPKLNLILINKKSLINAAGQMADAFPYEG